MRGDVFPWKSFCKARGQWQWGNHLFSSLFLFPSAAHREPPGHHICSHFVSPFCVPFIYLLFVCLLVCLSVCLSDTMIKPRFKFSASTAIFFLLWASWKGLSYWNWIFLLSLAARRQALTPHPHSPEEQQEELISFTLSSPNFYAINEITEESHLNCGGLAIVTIMKIPAFEMVQSNAKLIPEFTKIKKIFFFFLRNLSFWYSTSESFKLETKIRECEIRGK